MALFALYLDPQTIVSPVRLLHEVQTELFREMKALFTQLKISGKDERHKGEREGEIKREGERAGTSILQCLSYRANRCGTFHPVTMVSAETRSYCFLGY